MSDFGRPRFPAPVMDSVDVSQGGSMLIGFGVASLISGVHIWRSQDSADKKIRELADKKVKELGDQLKNRFEGQGTRLDNELREFTRDEIEKLEDKLSGRIKYLEMFRKTAKNRFINYDDRFFSMENQIAAIRSFLTDRTSELGVALGTFQGDTERRFKRVDADIRSIQHNAAAALESHKSDTAKALEEQEDRHQHAFEGHKLETTKALEEQEGRHQHALALQKSDLRVYTQHQIGCLIRTLEKEYEKHKSLMKFRFSVQEMRLRNELEAQASDMRKILHSLEEDRSASQKTSEGQEKRLRLLEEKFAAQEVDTNKLKPVVSQLQAENSKLLEEMQSLKSETATKVSGIQMDARNMKTEILNLREEHDVALSTVNKAHQALEEKLDANKVKTDISIADVAQEVLEVKERLNGRERAHGDLETEQSEQATSLQDLKTALSNLETDHGRLKDVQNTFQSQVADLVQEISDVEVDTAGIKKIAKDLQIDFDELTSEVKEAQGALADVEDKASNLETDSWNVNQRVSDLQSGLEKTQQTSEERKLAMKELGDKVDNASSTMTTALQKQEEKSSEIANTVNKKFGELRAEFKSLKATQEENVSATEESPSSRAAQESQFSGLEKEVANLKTSVTDLDIKYAGLTSTVEEQSSKLSTTNTTVQDLKKRKGQMASTALDSSAFADFMEQTEQQIQTLTVQAQEDRERVDNSEGELWEAIDKLWTEEHVAEEIASFKATINDPDIGRKLEALRKDMLDAIEAARVKTYQELGGDISKHDGWIQNLSSQVLNLGRVGTQLQQNTPRPNQFGGQYPQHGPQQFQHGPPNPQYGFPAFQSGLQASQHAPQNLHTGFQIPHPLDQPQQHEYASPPIAYTHAYPGHPQQTGQPGQ